MGITEKKFYRIRLANSCQTNSKMINGLTLNKQWQVKVGEIGDFAKFPDVEAQAVVKRGNAFVPAEEASGGADEDVDGHREGNGNPAQPGGGQAANTGNSAGGSTVAPDFASMTVEQLKNFLIAKGAAQSELRNTAKPELVERAEFIWSQK
jgi:hypothetical protein